MPKLHFPAQGGTHRPAWSPPTLENSSPPAVQTAGPAADERSQQILEDEVKRLRAELTRIRPNGNVRSAASNRGATAPMVWMALAACGACLLFALFALLRKG